MNIVQSLENLALIRLAISMQRNLNFSKMKEEFRKELGYFNINLFKSLIRERLLNSVLPARFQEKLIDLTVPINSEIQFLDREMSKFGIEKKLDICLTSSGTIDIVETVKTFVRSEHQNVIHRFALACHFWLTDDVLKIWNRSSVYERNDIESSLLHGLTDMSEFIKKGVVEIHLEIPYCLKKWFDWLHEGGDPRVLHNYLDESCLWYEHVPPEINLLRALHPIALDQLITMKFRYTKYGRTYFSCLDDKLKMNYFLLHQDEVLANYVNWPLQSKFLEMANLVWMHMSGRVFYCLLVHISRRTVDRVRYTFDYESLLHEFWNQSPDRLKVSAKNCHYSLRMRSFHRRMNVPEVVDTTLDKLMENTPLSLL